MSIAFTVPKWLMWLVGVPLGCFLLLALVVGIVFLIRPPRYF